MIKVIIKSFFFFKIKSYINFFKKNIQNKYKILGPFHMPKKIEKFTLLVSPHVDKNARDQLQIKFFKSFFYIKNFDKKLINFIFKNKNIEGIDIKFIFL